tara:strand:- start:138944 stop:139288 length:345 start_codon:yes stop_codon:yes gene_type:complete
MKNLKSIIAIFAISFATVFSSYAEETPPIEKTQNLRSEIISMLGSQTPFALDESSKAEIVFTVTSQNEIVVLSVNSESADFNSYVKSRLNYKKVDTKGLKVRGQYTLPVRLKSL